MKRWINRGFGLFLAAVLAIVPAVPQAAQQSINRGTTAGDGTGETLFSAFGKVNDNILDLQTNYAPLASPTFTGTVSGITKGMVGLGNVDNTADSAKPISTAVAAALPQFYATAASFPATGASNVLYVANDTGIQYRWTGSVYTDLSLASSLYDVRHYGAKVDGVALYDVSTTNSATSTITSATGSFTAADVGKPCAVIPAVASSAYPKYGTITGVANSTTATATLNVSPGALTGATFVYGTDDTIAVRAAISAAKPSTAYGYGTVYVPRGIVVTTDKLVFPDGVSLRGAGNTTTVDFARNFRHHQANIVLVNYVPSAGAVVLGDGSSSGKVGSNASWIDIDCLNLAPRALEVAAGQIVRTVHIDHVTAVRGTADTVLTGPSSVVTNSIFIQQQYGHVAKISGDSRFINNYVYGAGNGYHGIRISGVGDVQIIGNHIWKDADTPAALGSSIYLESWGTQVNKGQVTISANSFDTSFGPHIQIAALNTSVLRGVTITGNEGFQNDVVPNAAYPFIKINVDSGASIRALTISGNTGTGSWNDPTKGQYTYFVDGSGVAGHIYGSVTGGNAIDNCAAITNFSGTWAAWDKDSGNTVIPGTGTTVLNSRASGVATLVGGTVTVSTASVLAGSRVRLSVLTAGGTPGFLSVGTITAGTSFVINSSSGSDTSTVLWELAP